MTTPKNAGTAASGASFGLVTEASASATQDTTARPATAHTASPVMPHLVTRRISSLGVAPGWPNAPILMKA